MPGVDRCRILRGQVGVRRSPRNPSFWPHRGSHLIPGGFLLGERNRWGLSPLRGGIKKSGG